MIKVINNRTGKNTSFLFNYAHFICDCLFPEFVMKLHFNKNISKVIRLNAPRQSIGTFSNLYQKVMGIQSVEFIQDKYKMLNVPKLNVINKFDIPQPKYIEFRNYIFTRFNIKTDDSFPQILLIKRGNYTLNYKGNNNKNINMKSGSARREINNINILENKLSKRYGKKFQSAILQNCLFKKQVMLFHNAKLIIMAHGAGMANMFFCGEKTSILEVKCNTHWAYFDKLSNYLQINHCKCENNIEAILNKCVNLLKLKT